MKRSLLILLLLSVTAFAEQTPPAQKEVSCVKYREVLLAGPWGIWQKYMNDTLRAKYTIPNWSVEKLERYVDMLDAFGFNSIQFAQDRNIYVASRVKSPEEWEKTLIHLYGYAGKKGMRRSIFLWGNAAYNPYTKVITEYACWNDPTEKQLLLDYYEDKAKRFAPYIDHVITHWSDPGGCDRNGCTIKTALEMHNAIHGAFLSKNKNMSSSFSVWMLNNSGKVFKGWSGYESISSVLDAGILDKDVMIALMQAYNKAEGDKVLASGRKIGVWEWYYVDHEMFPSLPAQFLLMDNMMRKRLLNVPDQIEWFSVGSVAHGLNMHELYIAAHILKDPKLDVSQLLGEFCTKAFGDNGKAVEESLLYLQEIRYKTKKGGWGTWGEYYNDMGQVEVDIDSYIAKIAAIKKSLEGIKFKKDFQPAFPMVIPPEEYVKELTAQYRAVEQLFAFYKDVVDLKKSGKLSEGGPDLERIKSGMHQVDRPSEFMTIIEFEAYEKISKRELK